MTSDTLRTVLNLVLPFLQPLAGSLAPVFGVGMTMAELSAGSQTPVTPAAYAFSIWGPIFALGMVWGIWQALPAGRDSLAARRLGWPLAGAFAGSNLWMVLAALTGNGWHLVVVILLLLACALAAFFIARRLPRAGWADDWIVHPLTGLFAGWVAAASFVNIGAAARLTGAIQAEGFGATLVAILLLLAAAAVAIAVLWTARGAPWFAAAFAWALAGIAWANTLERELNPIVAIAAIGLLVLLLAVAWQRGRFGRPRQAAQS